MIDLNLIRVMGVMGVMGVMEAMRAMEVEDEMSEVGSGEGYEEKKCQRQVRPTR